MRYDARPDPHEDTPLARAKNTERSAARRRSRAAARAAATTEQEQDELEGSPETAERPATGSDRRPPLFKFPNVVEDVRALPGMFVTRKALWIPVVLLLVGATIVYLYSTGLIPVDLQGPAAMYIQFFFVPYGLFTFFLGGFLAPRAAYLVGLLLGVIDGLLWAILVVLNRTGVPGTEPTPAMGTAEITQVFVYAVVYGTLAAAFAGWYRNFLRRMSEQGRARRVQREADERARRRDERRAARRPTT